jgi:DNA repair protein RadC
MELRRGGGCSWGYGKGWAEPDTGCTLAYAAGSNVAELETEALDTEVLEIGARETEALETEAAAREPCSRAREPFEEPQLACGELSEAASRGRASHGRASHERALGEAALGGTASDGMGPGGAPFWGTRADAGSWVRAGLEPAVNAGRDGSSALVGAEVALSEPCAHGEHGEHERSMSKPVDVATLSDRELLAHAAGVTPTGPWPRPEWTVRAVDWLRREPEEFAVELGLAPTQARRLVAALELARRVLERPRSDLPSIRCARDAFEVCAPAFAGLEHEQFRVLALDAKHRVKQNVVVSVGSLTTSIVHPREVFRLAVRTASAAIVCVHNHPSGDPEPSTEDLEVTRRLAAVGRTLGIALLDHVVAGDNTFVSLRERISW